MGRNSGKPEYPVTPELGKRIAVHILDSMDEYQYTPASKHNQTLAETLRVPTVNVASVKSALTMLGLLDAHGERGGKAYKLSSLGKQVKGLMNE